VLDLARLLHDAGFGDTAEALVVALAAEQPLVALSIQKRRQNAEGCHQEGDDLVLASVVLPLRERRLARLAGRIVPLALPTGRVTDCPLRAGVT